MGVDDGVGVSVGVDVIGGVGVSVDVAVNVGVVDPVGVGVNVGVIIPPSMVRVVGPVEGKRQDCHRPLKCARTFQ